jgi:UDP-N-acetylmuramate-alanine ligase
VPEILTRLSALSKEGDVIAIFSNGGFDNIHKRLMETLSSPVAS